MATTLKTLTLCYAGVEFEVTVEGDVQSGGSNRYGSDEPAWADVVDVVAYSPATAKPVSARMMKWLKKEHGDYIAEQLIDESRW